ncbi:hypothetical protein VNO78_19010 [Psophocarpus tetragonolobus]|uniref:Uncharacterized protein n=1 Tax=Psophocarpus tetragonolobus TaxID=3891 RepID=A0AAN9XFM6_PSOTE
MIRIYSAYRLRLGAVEDAMQNFIASTDMISVWNASSSAFAQLEFNWLVISMAEVNQGYWTPKRLAKVLNELID